MSEGQDQRESGLSHEPSSMEAEGTAEEFAGKVEGKIGQAAKIFEKP